MQRKEEEGKRGGGGAETERDENEKVRSSLKVNKTGNERNV